MNPIGYWTGARPDTTDADILQKLESLYGSYFEELSRDDKASLLICLVEAAINPQQVLTEPNFYSDQNGGEAWLLAQQLSPRQQLGLVTAIANQLLHEGQNFYNYDYIAERVRRYNSQPSDDLLYRIASHAEILGSTELNLISQSGCLVPEQRYLIFNWLCCKGFEITGDLALLIFGREQLEQWFERSQQAYPHFEFYLCFEYQEKFKSGFDDGINFTMHWHPQPGAPMPLSETETDFPWRPFWDSGEMFWSNFPGGTTNHFDFNLYCYPDETSFTKPGWICEEGDWYTMKEHQDADLMSVAQVLKEVAVRV